MAAKKKSPLGGVIAMDGVQDTRKTSLGNNPFSGNYADEDALNSALTSASYTDAQIDGMTINDKVYAVRIANDSAGM